MKTANWPPDWITQKHFSRWLQKNSFDGSVGKCDLSGFVRWYKRKWKDLIQMQGRLRNGAAAGERDEVKKDFDRCL